MSDLNPCCLPCPTSVPPVQIPGPEGVAGTAVNGINGVNAYSIVVSDFLVPPDLVTPVTIIVSTSVWNVIGQVLIIGQGAGVSITNPGPATFEVISIPSPGALTLKFLHYPGDVAFGTQISAGAIVSPSGRMP